MGQDDTLRAELRARLECAYRVEEATSGPDGIARARALVPDLVLTDVTLSDVDGVALLATLRENPRTRHVPVVLLCAGDENAASDDALGLVAAMVSLVSDWEPLLKPRPPSAPRSPDDETFLDRLGAQVRDHMRDETFGASELADALAVSPRHLRRRLKGLTGEPTATHIRRIRLERAAALLWSGRLGVKEVVHATGFTSESGFRAAFREHYGTSPSAYQRAGPRSP